MRKSEGEHPATSPPPFHWDEWYASVGGRTIDIEEVNALYDHSVSRTYKTYRS